MRKTSLIAGLLFVAAQAMPATANAASSPERDTAHDDSHVQKAVVAQAGPPSGAPCSVGEGVTACYVANGDVFWVKDRRADGYHVDAIWTDGFDESHCHNRHGADAGWTYCDGFADDIPENSEIGFRGGVFEEPGHSPVGDGSWGAEIIAPTS